MAGAEVERFPLLAQAGFGRFWVADGVSMFGTYVTMLALQVLAVVTLEASATGVGLLGAARWLPYLLFGLLAGVLVDRHRRWPVLVGCDLARALLLGCIPVLVWLDALNLPLLLGLVLAIGGCSLLYDAAHQSFLPSLVPAALLTQANARLEQTSSVGQTGGPLLAGWLVAAAGAAAGILVDAVSYLVSGLILATVRVAEPVRAQAGRGLRRDLAEGLAWVYRHRMLGPLALTSHAWFLFNSMVSTVYVLYALQTLGLTAFGLGVTYALAGCGAVLGATGSTRAGRRFGVGPVIVAMRWLLPVAYLLLPLARPGPAALVLLGTAQFLFGLTLGLDGPVEMGYRQSVTPDRLQGRMNATMRSLNRGAVVLGAPAGGLLADHLGHRPTLWIAITGLAVQAAVLTASPFRQARVPAPG
ncbi:MAG TPA: MFS transporter [Mycobacteriales bacterium]|nr:MFS transporter [Mycobacteriales bacterium]